VNAHRPTPAENTAAILQRAAHAGLTVMIPGTLEPRVGRPVIRATTVTAESLTPAPRTDHVRDRERLEHEREGGGAPRERMAGRHEHALARLWQFVFHPAHVPIA